MSEFNLSAWALRNRSIIVYLMIVMVIAGALAYFRLGRSEDPSFIIKTMVVQAAWPGASVEDTLKQVTERLERKLQETPKLDFLRSFTSAGRTTIFVNLLGNTTASEVPDIWYHVRKSIGDIRHTLPQGIVGPGFNDDFGDTFGIIYGFTSDGFTHRELRDYVEGIRSKLLNVPDVSKIEILGAQDEKIFVEFSIKELAGLGIDRAALDRCTAGAEHRAARRYHRDRIRDACTARLRCIQVRAGCGGDQFCRRGTHAALERYRSDQAWICRSAAAIVPRRWGASHWARHCDA
jgi:multidrug efflux pump subunit AcrB